MDRRASGVVRAAVAVAIGLAMAFALAELAARLFDFDRFDLKIAMGPGAPPIFRYDQQLGWVNLSGRPDMNQQGFRFPRDYSRQKNRAGRIALLGDSQVWGFSVGALQHVGILLDGRLENVEVYPFGVPGYGPAQELLLLRQVARDYQVDAIVTVAFMENDLIDATLLMAYGGFQKPYMERREKGWSVANVPVPRPIFSSTHEAGSRSFFGRSRELRFLRPWPLLHWESAAYRTLVDRSTVVPRLASALAALRLAEVSTVTATASELWSVRRVDGRAIPCWLLSSCPQAHWLDGLPATVAAYDAMRRTCRERGIEFGVLVAPSLTELKLRRFPVADAVSREIEGRGIPVIDLRGKFRAAGNPDRLYVRDRHWTPYAHRLAAEAIERYWSGLSR